MTHKDFNVNSIVRDTRLNRTGVVTKITSRSVYVKFGKSKMRANRFYADEYLTEGVVNADTPKHAKS